MAINFDKSFEVDENGLSLTDEDGNVVYYLTSGQGNPTGSPAPINTQYIDQNTNLIYYKFGPGNNDWTQLKAEDLLFQGDAGSGLNSTNLNDAVNEAGEGPKKQVTQTGHGFTIPSYGVRPVYYNNVSGNYELAQADDIETSCDALVVEVIDANNFVIKQGGVLNVTHGLQVGIWYVLDTDNPGELISFASLSGVDVNVQYCVFTLTADTLLLQLDPIFTRDFFIPQDIAILEDWVQGGVPTLTAGNDRLLIAGIAAESSGLNSVTSMSIGGEAGTLLIEQGVTAGFNFLTSVYYWTDAQIENMTNNTLTVVYAGPGTVLDDQQFGAIIENVDQVNPVIATNTDSGTGATDTLGLDHDVLAGGFSFIAAGGGNTGMGFTNSNGSYTRKLDLTIASADGVIDDFLPSADSTPEAISTDITGSNRHVGVSASIRRREA